MKIAIYGHSGSQNHGNEAIVRGLHELFPDADLQLFTMSPDVDKIFGLDLFCDIRPYMSHPKDTIIQKLKNWLNRKNKKYKLKKMFAPILHSIRKDRIYCLEAGDQYNEPEEIRNWYIFLNNAIRDKGAKTVMLGCSITEDIINRKDVIEDLKRYSMIIARETLTYNLLLKAGIKAYLAPCPAFMMPAQACKLPLAFESGKDVIGFNVGFLAQGNEIYYEKLMKNFENAIQYVIDSTNCNILLVTHVNWSYVHSDRRSLEKLYAKFKDTGRIFLLEEKSAPEIKYILSKLKAFVALRTHTQIPAIASCIPTIIAGYKHKSLGISNDIYGENSHLLAHVQNLSSTNVIKEKLKYLLENYEKISFHINKTVPDYVKRTKYIVDLINNLHTPNRAETQERERERERERVNDCFINIFSFIKQVIVKFDYCCFMKGINIYA